MHPTHRLLVYLSHANLKPLRMRYAEDLRLYLREYARCTPRMRAQWRAELLVMWYMLQPVGMRGGGRGGMRRPVGRTEASLPQPPD